MSDEVGMVYSEDYMEYVAGELLHNATL